MTDLLLLLASWILASFMFLTTGATVLLSLRIEQVEGRPIYQAFLQLLLGMAAISAALGFVSLIMPVTMLVTAILAITCLLMLGMQEVRQTLAFNIRGVSALPWSLKITIGGLLMLVVFSTMLPSLNYDTGLYHNQFIMWMNRYPVIPGLANLHERFGFNSHWHLLAAGFNGYPYLSDPLNDMGGLLCSMALFAWAESAMKLIRNDFTFFDSLMLMFIVPIYLLARFLTSDTPDLPNSIIGFALLSIPFCKELPDRARLFFMAMVGGFLVTVKVSSVLLLATVVPSLFKVRHFHVLMALSLGLLILTPWMARTYQMSGYLIYPAKFTAVGSPDFQAPTESLDYVNALLESHGKFGRYDVTMVGRPMSEWVGSWVLHQTTAIKLMLIFCFVLAIPMLIYDLFRTIRSKWEYAPMLDASVHMAFILSMLIVFKLAPEIRYGYGSLLFYFVFILLRIGVARNRWLPLGFAAIGILMFARIMMVVRAEEPAPVLSKTYSEITGSAQPIYYPNEFDQCWEHELPCTNRYIEGLEMRTDKLVDGFRITKP
jgi:hypothetical protein